MLILLLVPFHAFLTVWASSIFGHYTALRLWKEALLILCITGALYLIAMDHKIRSHTLSRRLVWLIMAYVALNIVWGLMALDQNDVTPKALGYDWIVNLRFLAFFLLTWAVALRMARIRSHWQWLVYWPAIVVVGFGLLQALVLPDDFLRHFGYGPETIPVYDTINQNEAYVRAASTLRGANPLGAYLLIPISLLVVLLLRPKKRTWLQAGFLGAALVVLFFTFSRSAWIGALLSIAIILALSLRTRRSQRIALVTAGCLILAGAVAALTLSSNDRFENLVWHTQEESTIKVSSNHQRLEAMQEGLKDIANDPLGSGPGTAGPASFYNQPDPPRVSENYFVQIGQSVGVIGMAMFGLISVGVGYLLWLRRADPLALSLFASFVGLTFINMLSHAWTDDTIAYVWWGLAGVAMATLPQVPEAETATTLSNEKAHEDKPDNQPAKR